MDQAIEEINMRKFLFSVIFSLFLCILFGSISEVFAQNTFEIDKSEIIIPCPPGTRTHLDSCRNGTSIKISIKSSERFEFKVSGGKLNGSGSEIGWDLSRVKPGTYEISANFYDSNNSYQTVKKTVTVKECPDCTCTFCECPLTSISIAKESVKSGDLVTINANSSGGSQTSIEFRWMVSDGKIIEGQGTPVIQLDTKDAKSKEIRVELELIGICADCGKVTPLIIELSDR